MEAIRAIAQTHNQLVQIIGNEVIKRDFSYFKNTKQFLIISVIEEARVKAFVDAVLDLNPSAQMVIVAQDYVAEGFKKNFDKKATIVSWKGAYSNDTLEAVYKQTDIKDFDAFVFFSDMPINLRDINLLELSEFMTCKGNVAVLSCTIGNEVYEYSNVGLYTQALKTYDEINKLIGVYFDTHSNA